jgi:hypothetical protein
MKAAEMNEALIMIKKIMNIISDRNVSLLLISVPSVIFMIIDPMATTLFSKIWILIASIAIMAWYVFILNKPINNET